VKKTSLTLILSVILLSGVLVFGNQSARPFFETRVIFEADSRFSAHSYPTIAVIPDGRLFMTWTVSENKKPRVVGSFSRDGGKTWAEPEELINTPGFGDYDPNIIIARGEIQVYSTSTPLPQKLISYSETWKTTRRFDGSQWTRPEKLPQIRKYLVGKIHVGLTLRDGTLVMPYSWDIPAEMDKPVTSEGQMNLKSGALLSQDNGRTWTPSLRDGSIAVSGDATPPDAETCIMPLMLSAKTITPSRFHEPPTMFPCTSHIVCAGPPEISIFASLPPD